jgi:predicted permease
MSDLLFSVNTVFPFILLAALGYLLRRLGMLTPGFLAVASQILYSVCFPFAIFGSLAGAELSILFSSVPVLFLCIFGALVPLALIALMPRLVKDHAKAASLAQGIYRNNNFVQGIPLMTSYYGASGTVLAMLMTSFSALFENFFSVTLFLAISPQKSGQRSFLRETAKALRNPVVLGCLLGFGFSLLGWSLPTSVQSAVQSVGNMATPLAMLVLGAQFDPAKIIKDLRQTLPAALVHLIVIPGIFVAAAALLGLRGMDLSSILFFTGTVNAASGPTLAANMGGDEDLASQLLCLTMVLSTFTLILGIYLLRILGLS